MTSPDVDMQLTVFGDKLPADQVPHLNCTRTEDCPAPPDAHDDDCLKQRQLREGRSESTRTSALPRLTDRQVHALKLIRHRQPVRSDELGAHLHAFRQAHGGSGHPADETCDYCTSEGRSVGEALAKKGLARYVRGEGWVTAEWQGSDPGQVVQASSQLGPDDPWPDGF